MNRRIATLHSSDKKKGTRSNSPSSDDEKQGFFVGGSGQSGNLVLGSDSSRSEDFVSQFFKSVRAHGAEPLTDEENLRLGTHDAIKLAPRKKGYNMPDGTEQSDLLQSTEPLEIQEVAVAMWENGFTVDDGPLRLYSDTLNHPFLQSVREGRIPIELIRQHPGKIIDIRMERRRETYVVKPKPFTGQGQRLGELVPEFDQTENMEQKTSSCANLAKSPRVDSESVKKAQEAIKLVDGEPTTHIHIRLPSGERIMGQFNRNHTVGDIRNFLIIAAPGYAFQPFSFMTIFPSKVIEHENISLKEAGLLNAVIIVKLM
ncbi:SEP domain family protein [Acanthocheilonema viteae]